MNKKLSRKEIDDLKNEIAFRNTMTKKLGNWIKILGSFFLLFGALAIWGFMGLNDNFLQVSDGVRDVVKWISAVLAAPLGVLTVMFIISFRNSKRSTLRLIDILEGKVK